MRVGVYIDGYNLYYGARSICGRSTQGWRWLDVRALAERLVAERRNWQPASVNRVVYCTARIDPVLNPEAYRDQDVYLKALVGAGSVDHIEFGNYVARAKPAMLADEDEKRRPMIASSRWPVMVRDSSGGDVRDARFMVKVLNIEEKGSDVNVATHLMGDVLSGAVEAAVVFSNDSDLKLPVHRVRERVPVGVINPHPRQLAGALRGNPEDGVGRHWWRQLRVTDLKACQLSDAIDGYERPSDW